MSSIFIQLFLLAHVTWGQKLVPWLTHTHTHLHLAWGLGWALPAGLFVLCMCVPEGAQCLWVTLCVTVSQWM